MYKIFWPPPGKVRYFASPAEKYPATQQHFSMFVFFELICLFVNLLTCEVVSHFWYPDIVILFTLNRRVYISMNE